MTSLLVESWTWYSIACLILLARYVSRWLQLGSIRRFQADDYVMLLTFGFYTVLVSVMNIVAHLDTNLMTPDDIAHLTPKSTLSRIYGSKLVLVVEQSMIMTTWGCKVCLLLMYNKLTFGLKQHIAVKVIGGYVFLSWLLMEILYFGVWCRPFHQYWAVPVQNIQCSTALHHLIVNAVFNISSDLLIVSIPLPLLITSKLPRTKKLILCCLFGLAMFVILCAVLNKYYSFANPFSPMWTFWYIREASTAVYVANMPMCWSLLRHLFNLRAFNSYGSSKTGTTTNLQTMSRSLAGRAIYAHDSKNGTLKSKTMKSKGGGDREGGAGMSWWEREGVKRTESEEFIVTPPGKAVTPQSLEIWESKEFDIVNDVGSVRGGAPVQGDDEMFDGGRKTKTVVTVRTSDESKKG